MHADHDYELRRGWGHSPARAGVVVAERAGAKKLALFHHSPDATDAMIDEVVAAHRVAVPPSPCSPPLKGATSTYDADRPDLADLRVLGERARTEVWAGAE